jgi:protein SCO1
MARVFLTVLALGFAAPVSAHDDKLHKSPDETAEHVAPQLLPEPMGLPLPLDLGGQFRLIDQNGRTRTQVEPNGNFQLVFFGYANCREICSAALPQMAEVADRLASVGVALTPVLITVDPARDTVATLGPALGKFSPNFVGLTGDDAALEKAYQAFSIDNSLVFDDPQHGPVYAHGGFLYLLDADGTFLTVIPPILSTDRVIDLISTYAPQG